MDKPDTLSVTAGDIAALEVKVCGTPELVPKWFKDGVELASGRKYKISFSRMISSLNVLSAEKMDSGEYTFEVMNEVGKDLSKINLTVLGWCLLSTRAGETVQLSASDVDHSQVFRHYSFLFTSKSKFLNRSMLKQTETNTKLCPMLKCFE